MASENAKQVAQEVARKVSNGEKVNLSDIMRKKGYSKKSARSMKVKETKTFQEEINPIVQAMIAERERAIKAMKGKISKAKYRDLTDALDKLTKNIQLLSGKETEKQNIVFEWEK